MRTTRSSAPAGGVQSSTQIREERMRVLVEAIARHQAVHGYAPAMRELVERTGFSSTSVVAYWLDACERAGLIVRTRGIARAVALTAAGRALAGVPSERESPTAG